MHAQRNLRRPQLVGNAAIALLTGAGALIFWFLVLELHPPVLSRPALALQGTAVALALLLTYWYRPPRFFLYPLVLAGVIYLWDTTLPPPSLPDGPLRRLIPHAVLIGLLADLFVSLRRRAHRPLRNATRVYGGYMELEGTARVLAIPAHELRGRLRRAGRIILVSKNGAEYLSLDDLMAVLARWNVYADLGRQNGDMRQQDRPADLA